MYKTCRFLTLLAEDFEPIPEKEMGVEEVENLGSDKSGRRYVIKHIERTQKVGFRFIVASPTNVNVTLHPFNDEGDVDFVPRAISQIQEENYYLARFISLYLMYELVPPVLLVIPFELGRMAAAIVRLGILFAMFPTLKPFAIALSNLISRVSLRKGESQVTIDEIRADVVNIHNFESDQNHLGQNKVSQVQGRLKE